MAERVRVGEIDDDEGRRRLCIICRGSGRVVTWRRARMVLLSALGTPVGEIAGVAFTGVDRVRDVVRNFDVAGFEVLCPTCKGGRPGTFTLRKRRDIKETAKSGRAAYGLPFLAWSLLRPAGFLVAAGVVDDFSQEGLRVLLAHPDLSGPGASLAPCHRPPV